MILHIKGKVDEINDDGSYFISVFNGFSFQIECLKNLLPGNDADLWLYMILKEVEGKMDLKFYGFESKIQITDFERLMSISGVGPKMAFSIVKNIPKEQFILAIQKGDYASIKKIPGIGDKLAKRIVLELSRVYSKDNDVVQKLRDSDLTDDQKEVITSLTQMGFDKGLIMKSINEIDKNLSKKEMLTQLLFKVTNNSNG